MIRARLDPHCLPADIGDDGDSLGVPLPDQPSGTGVEVVHEIDRPLPGLLVGHGGHHGVELVGLDGGQDAVELLRLEVEPDAKSSSESLAEVEVDSGDLLAVLALVHLEGRVGDIGRDPDDSGGADIRGQFRVESGVGRDGESGDHRDGAGLGGRFVSWGSAVGTRAERHSGQDKGEGEG